MIASSCVTTGYVYWDDVYYSPSNRTYYNYVPPYRYYSPYFGFYGYPSYRNYYQRPDVIIITPKQESNTTPGRRPDRSGGGSQPELNRRRIN